MGRKKTALYSGGSEKERKTLHCLPKKERAGGEGNTAATGNNVLYAEERMLLESRPMRMEDKRGNAAGKKRRMRPLFFQAGQRTRWGKGTPGLLGGG